MTPQFAAMQVEQRERWIEQLFGSRAAKRGAVARRLLAWVDREVGRKAFEAEVRRRGYHLIQTAHQLIVVCYNGPIRILF